MSDSATSTPTKASDPHAHVAHIVPLWMLAAVFGGLLVLTWLTWIAYDVFDFGTRVNLIIAMAIAVVKASLVVLYFMHLRWDKPINAIVFISSLLFLAIFIVLALLDSGQYRDNIIDYRSAATNRSAPQLQVQQVGVSDDAGESEQSAAPATQTEASDNNETTPPATQPESAAPSEAAPEE